MRNKIKIIFISIGLTALTITAFVVCGKLKPPWSSALIAIGIFQAEMLTTWLGTILLVKGANMARKKNWAAELADKSGKTRAAIYAQAKRLGRRPTLREVKNQRHGRPPKF